MVRFAPLDGVGAPCLVKPYIYRDIYVRVCILFSFFFFLVSFRWFLRQRLKTCALPEAFLFFWLSAYLLHNSSSTLAVHNVSPQRATTRHSTHT